MKYALVGIKHANEQPAGLSIEMAPIGVKQSLLELNCCDFSGVVRIHRLQCKEEEK